MKHVAAAVIRNESGELLLCRREAVGNCADLWEFPGGKLEPWETLEECVKRECREELGVDIAVAGLFAETSQSDLDSQIAFTFFEAKIVGGMPQRRVHRELRWVRPQELNRYALCPADRNILSGFGPELEDPAKE